MPGSKHPSAVDHPTHYNQGPKCIHCNEPIECIDVIEDMTFNLGNAVKYIWRAGLKTEDPRQDLEKSIWYLHRELARISK